MCTTSLLSPEKIVKVIAIEEHYCPAEVSAAWRGLPAGLQDPSQVVFDNEETNRRLEDLGELRLRHMDEMGVDVQVISLTTPATQVLDTEAAVRLARLSNDMTAKAVASHPDRLQGFATLPTPNPKEATRELERCVGELGMKGAMLTGRTRERPLDAPEFFPILEAAAKLRVPLYLHPQIPLKAVRDACYTGFGETVDAIFAAGGWGWHADAGTQALRLILSGTFDRLPDLQVILGHWGEVIMLYLDRIGPALDKGIKGKLDRTVENYMKENFHVTPSGIFSERYLRNAVEVMGVDRIMFSVDYPYVFVPGARDFLTNAALSAEDKAKIAHGNWERLTGLAGAP